MEIKDIKLGYYSIGEDKLLFNNLDINVNIEIKNKDDNNLMHFNGVYKVIGFKDNNLLVLDLEKFKNVDVRNYKDIHDDIQYKCIDHNLFSYKITMNNEEIDFTTLNTLQNKLKINDITKEYHSFNNTLIDLFSFQDVNLFWYNYFLEKQYDSFIINIQDNILHNQKHCIENNVLFFEYLKDEIENIKAYDVDKKCDSLVMTMLKIIERENNKFHNDVKKFKVKFTR